MAQFLFSKRYFHPQELNKCLVLKAVVVIDSRFKIILNIVVHTLTLKTFIQKSNFKIPNIFTLLSSTEQDFTLLVLYKHRTKREPTASRSLQFKYRTQEVFNAITINNYQLMPHLQCELLRKLSLHDATPYL